ncbi:MAG: sigma-70 family RNA polymerase sigma factor [Acidobacteria bacterium]|nr:sigma-70 family RNA polymerase sigma factor [Acidobacteriota bacterium]
MPKKRAKKEDLPVLASAAAPPGLPAIPEEAPLPADPLRRYLAEIRGFPRLTREEEHALAVRVREGGDRDAAARLATGNLRLVVQIAMDYRRSYLNMLDLIQEGNIGLLQGIKKYDPYRGVPFSAYAGYWIRAYLLKYLLDHWSLVRVGTTNARRKLFYNLKREQERLRSLGITAGTKLLARNLDADEQDVIEVSQALKGRDVSIDAPVGRPGSDDDRFVWETMAAGGDAPDEQVARAEMQAILKEKIAEFAKTLKDKERYILETRLVAEEPATLQEIGDHYGTTREAVRQMESKLIARLREYLKSEIKDLRRFEVKSE